MRTKQAAPPTLNAVFCTLASNPQRHSRGRLAVAVQVLDEQPAALNSAAQEGHTAHVADPGRPVRRRRGPDQRNSRIRHLGRLARHTFLAMLGAVIARGEDYREVFRYFRPDFDLDASRQARLDAGLGEYLNGNDF